MALSPPSGIIIEYDNAGGTPVDITQFVMTLNGISLVSITEETHSFGDSWEENQSVGLGRVNDVELGGLYDDVASGPDSLFAGRVPEAPTATTRTFKVTWRSGKTTSFETRLMGYDRTPDRNGLTKYVARLKPTGAVTEV